MGDDQNPFGFDRDPFVTVCSHSHVLETGAAWPSLFTKIDRAVKGSNSRLRLTS